MMDASQKVMAVFKDCKKSLGQSSLARPAVRRKIAQAITEAEARGRARGIEDVAIKVSLMCEEGLFPVSKSKQNGNNTNGDFDIDNCPLAKWLEKRPRILSDEYARRFKAPENE